MCPLEQEQGHQNYSYHRTGIPVTLIGVLLNVCDSWHFTLKRACDKGEGTRQGALYALCRGTDFLLGILGSEHIEIVPRQLEGGPFTRVQLPSLKMVNK